MNQFVANHKQNIYNVLNIMLIVLSVGLILYLSVLGMKNIEFFSNRSYMTFQLWVCYMFIADFFIELYLAEDKGHYFRRRFLFLLLSVPYLNIVAALHIPLRVDTLYFLRFIPLARGALAMSIVVGYISRNRITNIFASYVVVFVASVYFGSLILYEMENRVNPDVNTYWTALWWACSVATTAGCGIYPLTLAGKIVVAVLPTMGIVMFPFFTVVVTNTVQEHFAKAFLKQKKPAVAAAPQPSPQPTSQPAAQPDPTDPSKN